jgi:hypothetical protein
MCCRTGVVLRSNAGWASARSNPDQVRNQALKNARPIIPVIVLTGRRRATAG